MRTSLDKSEERAAVEEKAYSRCEYVKVLWSRKNAREQSRRVAGDG
jgi:hypothetical protein